MNEVPMERIKESMQATWMAGDFGVIAKTISGGAERFVDALSIQPGMRVLDVATGTGNLAIPIARKGAVVTGVDIATNLLTQARERAKAEGLEVQFDEGDAEALPYADGSFDLVVTMFGAIFAPRPVVVAEELGRVLRQGGELAMANWNPASFSGQMFKVAGKHAPGPPGIPSPLQWGEEAILRQRLEPYFTNIKTELVPVKFDLPMPPAQVVEFFRKYFGPAQMAFKRVGEAGEAALTEDLIALWAGANVAEKPEEQTLIMNQFLRVTATRM